MNSCRIPATGSTLRISNLAILFILWLSTGGAFAQIVTYDIVDTGQTKCYDANAETTAPVASAPTPRPDPHTPLRPPAQSSRTV